MSVLPLPPRPAAVSATTRLVANVVASQVGWFACVLGAARGAEWLGVVLAVSIVAGHVAFVGGPARRGELRLIALALAIGMVLDTAMAATGLLRYAAPGPLAPLAPAWILALWALFASTLTLSMRWLHARPSTAAVLGAVAGPLSYMGAEKLGAVTLIERTPALVVLGVAWAAVMPLLLLMARRVCDQGSRDGV